MIQPAVLYYVLASLPLHVLQPDVSPLAMPLSVYVLGSGGVLMTLTFFALATALVTAGYALRLRLRATWNRHLGVFFPALAGVVVLLALSVIAFVAIAAPRDLAGLAQRVVFVLLFAWLLLVARRLVELRAVEIGGGERIL